MNSYRPVPVMNFRMGAARPPALRLSEGSLSAPALSPAAKSALQDAVNNISDSLTMEIQALLVELDLVSASAVRVDPNSGSEISNIGSLPPQEIRTAISAAAQQLSGLAGRALTGSLSPYLTSDQTAELSQQKAQADQINSVISNLDTTPISPGDQGVVQAYLDSHTSGPSAAIADAEKAVVTAEAGSVPVIEPSEKDVTIKIAIGVGLVAVTGFVLWRVFG